MKASQQPIVGELSYEKFYLENYEVIRLWALQITNHEYDLADELIQDIYLKLYKRECPQNYESIRAYIYTSLRNGFNTQLRKRSLSKMISLSDSIAILDNIYAYDPRSVLPAQDKIKEICNYICWRKETSLAAGIFILRFFLGYHPKEISIITKRRKNAIEARLVKIRREINCLPKNSNLTTGSDSNPKISPRSKKNRTESIWADLIQTIYSYRSGGCPTLDEYVVIYSTNTLKPDRTMISHFVSCPRCLDRINTMLGLPKIVDRAYFASIISAIFSVGFPLVCW